jgi:bifunctional non-homologous end joining protein LigD
MTINSEIQQFRFANKDRINKKGHKYRSDLMLEKDGIVERWAIQKGLPLEPIHSTPYPAYKMSDLDLSKIVSEGPLFKNNVNVGEVKIVDSGTYKLIYWYENNVEIVLLGQKIKGTYTLFHNDKMKKKKDWLINKKAP